MWILQKKKENYLQEKRILQTSTQAFFSQIKSNVTHIIREGSFDFQSSKSPKKNNFLTDSITRSCFKKEFTEF